MTPARRRLQGAVALGAGALLLAAFAAPVADAEPTPPVATEARSPLEATPELRQVRLAVPGSAELAALEDSGVDLTGNVERVPSGLEVDALVSEADLDALPAGATLAGRSGTVRSQRAPAPRAVAPAETDELVVARADWFTTKGQGFLSLEVKSSLEEAAVLTASWPGGSSEVEVEAYVDSGEYLYHRVQVRVDDPRPDRVTITSSLGGEAEAEVTDWLYEVDDRTARPGYQSEFVAGYENPTELYQRIEELAAAYPELAEIVELPNATNGYRRLAQAVLGSEPAASVVLSSRAWGHEGGNDLTAEVLAPSGPDQALDVSVDGDAVTVALASDAAGTATSTAAEVVQALQAEAGELLTATTYRGEAGTGTVAAQGVTALTDFLSAPEEISRDPWPMRAIRIGKHRDGSKPGVLIQAQDHAREWVTPLVAVESAEQLLANYATDAEIRSVVDNTDVFIIPSNNPDGAHYSFFDAASQRRNMTDHCPAETSDPGYRNSWGVDLNRNYTVGSVYDGFTGGSTSCTSNTYAGPEELSEPEAKNVVWLAENHDNLKFFMTIHSNGGQLFWQPGAYIADGRVTTPRPPLRDEEYYWQMAERILSGVNTSRDTVVQPRNVGGSSDVLYSSAGNVREELYFNYGIYAFGWEIGGSTWDPEAGEFVSGSFQPEWPEADQQYQEYSAGVIEMFKIAAEWGKDDRAAGVRVAQRQQRDRSVEVTFTTNEPATVHYTTDGSTPTLDSPTYQTAGVREGGETLRITETTTFRYLSVDVADNVSPERSFTVRVRR